jgi:alpha-tubulin suppressor-like RCC1 family protein
VKLLRILVSLVLLAQTIVFTSAANAVISRLQTDFVRPPLNAQITEATSTSVTIEWEKPTQTFGTIDGYSIRYSQNSGTDWITSEVVGENQNQFKIEELNHFDSYIFHIATLSSQYQSEWVIVQAGSTKFTKVFHGGKAACGITSDRETYCWGRFEISIDDTPLESLGQWLPTSYVPKFKNAIWISLNGSKRICAVIITKKIECLGTPSPTNISTAKTVEVGESSACSLLDNGTVWCWGRNNWGQLGDTTYSDSSSAVRVANLSGVTSIEAGVNHYCALKSDGTSWCWGYNLTGQLGNGTQDNSSVAIHVNALENITDISIFEQSSCALLATGDLYCWGSFLGLNDGGDNGSTTPIFLLNVPNSTEYHGDSKNGCFKISNSNVKCRLDFANAVSERENTQNQIELSSKSGTSACIVTISNEISCWGSNMQNRLGNNQIINTGNGDSYLNGGFPRAIIAPSAPRSIRTFDGHMCILFFDQSSKCTGINKYPFYSDDKVFLINGDLDTIYAQVPINSTNGYEIDSIDGDQDYLCGTFSSHTVKCWGYFGGPSNKYGDNDFREIGMPEYANTPVLLPGSNGATELQNRCVLYSNGSVKCWGENSDGHIGDGSFSYRSSLTPVAGIENAIQISQDFQGYCALLETGSVTCWGSYLKRLASPEALIGIQNAIKIEGSCALLADNQVKCWNSSRTQFTNLFQGLGKVLDFSNSGGEDATCALISDGAIYCLGSNVNGGVGDGSGVFQSTPKKISGSDRFISISSTNRYSTYYCAIKFDGEVKCWGNIPYVAGSSIPKSLKLPVSPEYQLPSPPEPVMADSIISSNTTSSSIDLAWSSPFDNGSVITGYETRLFRSNEEGDPEPEPFKKILTIENAISLSDLESSKTYYVCIVAISSMGAGSCDSYFTFTTLGVPPDKVTGIYSSVNSKTSVTVTWEIPNSYSLPILNYKVRLSTDQLNWTTQDRNTNSIVLSNLSPSVTYFLQVTAVNSAGSSEASEILSFITNGTKPERITNIHAAPVGSESIHISWEVPDSNGNPIIWYFVKYSSDRISWNTAETELPELIIENLQSETTYYLRVASQTIGGTSDYSDEISVLTNAQVPEKISQINVGEIYADSVYLTWEIPESFSQNITKYKVEYSKNQSKWFSKEVISNATKLINLDVSTQYFIRISSQSAAGLSEPSEINFFNTLNGIPAKVSELSSKKIKKNFHEFQFESSIPNGSPVSRYSYRWKLSTAKKWTGWINLKLTKTAQISGWIKGKTYLVQIKTLSKYGSSVSKAFKLVQTK